MLCRPCKSALKRARHATVQDFPGTPPMVTMPAGLFPPPQARAGSPGARRVDANRETAQRLVLALLALALLAAAAYVGRRGIQGDAAESAQAMPAAQPGAASAPPAAVPVPEPPPRVVIAEPAPVVRASASARTSSAKPASTRRLPPPPAAAAPPSPPPNETMAAVAEAPPALPVARAPAPPDRWQLMADSLARCADEGGLSGFICGQRVRIESCDGYWGRVAQCANRPDAPP